MDPFGGFVERWYAPSDDPSKFAFFGGRVDYGNTISMTITEVGPLGSAYFKGMQVSYYSDMSDLTGARYSPSGYPVFSSAGQTLVLPGKYGTYTYTYTGAGVVGYTYKLRDNVVYAQPIGGTVPLRGDNVSRAIKAIGGLLGGSPKPALQPGPG